MQFEFQPTITRIAVLSDSETDVFLHIGREVPTMKDVVLAGKENGIGGYVFHRGSITHILSKQRDVFRLEIVVFAEDIVIFVKI